MSHVAECKTVLKNLDLIEAAAIRLGGTLRRDQHTMRWFENGFVDDSNDWRTMFSEAEANRIASLPRADRVKIINAKMSRPDHVISFPGAKYDVGVFANENGTFSLRWDYFSEGGLMRFMGDRQAGAFSQAYGIEATKRAARLRGYVTKEVQRPNGQIQLEVMVR